MVVELDCWPYADFHEANSLVAVGDEEGRVRLMESSKDPNSVYLSPSTNLLGRASS